MIKSWIFEFLYASDAGGEVTEQAATIVFDNAIALWPGIEALGLEGIFFSEHLVVFRTDHRPIC